MAKINRILTFIVVILAVVLIVLGLFWYWQTNFRNQYYAVYLDTGDLYFGKLSRFPYLTLSNVWYLQRGGQGQNVSLSDFSKVAWGPENSIRLNRDKIVWIAKISDTSQLIPLLSGQASPYTQSGVPSQGFPSQSATSTP